LELWIQEYPHDFAVGAAAAALNALVKSIVSKPHLLHYGSDFLPFLEGRPLIDKDADWAMKVDESAGDENDEYLDDDDDDGAHPNNALPPTLSSPIDSHQSQLQRQVSQTQLPVFLGGGSTTAVSARERKSSLPLSAKVLMNPNLEQKELPQPQAPKAIIRDLLSMAAQLDKIDSDIVAQEITRIEQLLFNAIEVSFRSCFEACVLRLIAYKRSDVLFFSCCPAEALVATYTCAG
jgi:hypothetical protein